MKHFLLFLLFVLVLSSSSLHAQDQLNVKSKQLYSTYTDNSPALLLDQNTLPTAQSIVSNDLRGRNPDSSLVQCADNFTVPGGVQWTIDSIALTGTYSVPANMDSMVVAIYTNNAGVPSNTPIMVRTTRPVLGITTGTNMAVKFSSPIVLAPGDYWISIYAVYNTASSLAQGRWNWSTSTTPTAGLNCHIRDYTGLFGLPPFPWTLTSTLVPGEVSHLFALFGTSGPPSGPGSLCFNRTGLNLQLPDNSPVGIRDTIKVPNNSGTLTDITVVIDNITHTWIGDLIAVVSHGGQADTLLSRIGTGTFGNSSDNLTNVRLTDSAAAPIAGIGNAVNPSNGSWLPGGRSGVDSLKKHFVRSGSPANQLNGNWDLWVSDNAAGDTGRVHAWSICFYSDNLTQIISNSSETPDRYTLGQNYPNPFNPTTKINFSIPKAGLVSLKVYDMLGREVSSLVNRELNAGVFTAEFNGAGLSSGTYFYRLQVNDFVEIKKMVLLK